MLFSARAWVWKFLICVLFIVVPIELEIIAVVSRGRDNALLGVASASRSMCASSLLHSGVILGCELNWLGF